MSFWQVVEIIIFGFNLLILVYFISLNGYYLFLSTLSVIQLLGFKIRRSGRKRKLDNHPFLPTVSILSPAYNEEQTIAESVSSLTRVNYPKLEIIVINDGSSDGTLMELKQVFDLRVSKRKGSGKLPTMKVNKVYRSGEHENLFVIDKENGGKADALNAGINLSRADLFCAIDADSILEKNALMRLVEDHMTRGSDVIALGGIVRIANGCEIKDGEVIKVRTPKKILPGLQVVEYIRAFLCGRSGFNLLNSLLIISGAFGLFRRDVVIEVGGYDSSTVGEDMELVTRLHRFMRMEGRNYRVLFVPDPICWTQAPESLKVLQRQRNRWQRGLLESILKNREMIMNPKYGNVGMIAVPFFLFFEGIGPFFEVMGYMFMVVSLICGWINFGFFLLFLFLAIIMGVILTMFALIMEEVTVKKYHRLTDLIKLLLLGVFENLGYRQLVTIWRMRGLWDFVRGNKKWGKMTRKKFS